MPLLANLASSAFDSAQRAAEPLLAKLPPAFHQLARDLHAPPLVLATALAAVPAVLVGTMLATRRRRRAAARGKLGKALSSGSGKKGGKLPPHVKHAVPFIGSMVTFGMDPIKFLVDHRAELGDVFTFTMFGREMTYCLGTEGNNAVFNAKHAQANAEAAYNSLTKPVFGDGVVYDSPNHLFMEQRKWSKYGLSLDNLRAYVPMIEEETRAYFARWSQQKGTAELFSSLAELTIMTASRCLMGPEVRAKLDESVAALYHDLDQGFQPINFLFEWLPLPAYFRRDRAQRKMREIFLSIMAERRAAEQAGEKREYNDILHVYMTACYKDGTKFSDRDAAHMMIALLMAGQHTSSTTGTWCLSYLAANPDVWRRVVAELQSVLGKNLDGALDFDALKQLPLLDAVLRETLRLRPPLTSIMRKVVQPIEVGGYVVPAGHYLCASPTISQLDGDVFDDPLKWDPDRWLQVKNARLQQGLDAETEVGEDFGFGNVGGSARSHYLPFGAGRHRCIGEPFAYVQIKTILVTMMREFASLEFVAPATFPERDFTSMVVMPQKPATITYTRRRAPMQARSKVGGN